MKKPTKKITSVKTTAKKTSTINSSVWLFLGLMFVSAVITSVLMAPAKQNEVMVAATKEIKQVANRPVVTVPVTKQPASGLAGARAGSTTGNARLTGNATGRVGSTMVKVPTLPAPAAATYTPPVAGARATTLTGATATARAGSSTVTTPTVTTPTVTTPVVRTGARTGGAAEPIRSTTPSQRPRPSNDPVGDAARRQAQIDAANALKEIAKLKKEASEAVATVQNTASTIVGAGMQAAAVVVGAGTRAVGAVTDAGTQVVQTGAAAATSVVNLGQNAASSATRTAGVAAGNAAQQGVTQLNQQVNTAILPLRDQVGNAADAVGKVAKVPSALAGLIDMSVIQAQNNINNPATSAQESQEMMDAVDLLNGSRDAVRSANETLTETQANIEKLDKPVSFLGGLRDSIIGLFSGAADSIGDN